MPGAVTFHVHISAVVLPVMLMPLRESFVAFRRVTKLGSFLPFFEIKQIKIKEVQERLFSHKFGREREAKFSDIETAGGSHFVHQIMTVPLMKTLKQLKKSVCGVLRIAKCKCK